MPCQSSVYCEGGVGFSISFVSIIVASTSARTDTPVPISIAFHIFGSMSRSSSIDTHQPGLLSALRLLVTSFPVSTLSFSASSRVQHPLPVELHHQSINYSAFRSSHMLLSLPLYVRATVPSLSRLVKRASFKV